MKNVEERREIKIKAPQFLLRGRFTRKMRIVLTQLSSYGANIGATFWGLFFRGTYLPQK